MNLNVHATLIRLHARLEKVQIHPDQDNTLLARCQDCRNIALKVGECDDGTILITCHTCGFRRGYGKTLSAIGLTEQDMIPTGGRAKQRETPNPQKSPGKPENIRTEGIIPLFPGAKSEIYTPADVCGEPMPLPTRDLPTFPVDTFPRWLKDCAEQEALAKQTPVDLYAILGLLTSAY